MTRRQLLKNGSPLLLGALFAGHAACQKTVSSAGNKNTHLIHEIKILTAVPLEKMIGFYQGQIGFPIIKNNRRQCSFQAGRSILTFIYTNLLSDPPFYHFAFNIPENKIRYAEEWQLKKTDIIQPPPHLLDENNYGKNIVHFRHWDAHSIFFYDPAGNVVEYIARHTLGNPATGKFTHKDILYISEIGLIVDDVQGAFKEIQGHLPLEKYSTSSNNFLAMGDEKGLLLLMGNGTPAVFRKGRKRKVFETTVVIYPSIDIAPFKMRTYPYLMTDQP